MKEVDYQLDALVTVMIDTVEKVPGIDQFVKDQVISSLMATLKSEETMITSTVAVKQKKIS